MNTDLHPLLVSQIQNSALSKKTLKQTENLLNEISTAYYELDASAIAPNKNGFAYENIGLSPSTSQNIVNNIDEVIFEVDHLGNWTYLNPAWEKLTGLEVNECLGRPFFEFLDTMKGTDQLKLKNLLHADFTSYCEVLATYNPKVGRRWLEISLKKLPSHFGEKESYIGIISDVTAQKKVELSLLRAKEKEMSANKAKGEFLSTMSHEIRTPLNAVIGTTHLLLLENPSSSQLENLNILKHASEHLLALVNDILDFNKIESGNIELEHIVFNFDNRLDSLLCTYGKLAAKKKIDFTINKQSGIPEFLVGDSTRLSQILTNLVSNAIKFTDEGEVALNVGLLSQSDEDVVLKFEVIDTGIGISECKQEKIFDVFSQASSNTTRKFGGTGLGLNICRKLLQMMNSDIKVRSELGVGSIFSFELTFELSEEENVRNNYVLKTSSSDNKLNGLSILVAEDHKVNILMIQKFLSRWDTVVDIAQNGKEALEKSRENKYDVILMDLQMPELNGFEASREIRKFNEEIPIIALSASSATLIEDELGHAGIDGHIGKPFNPNTLFDILKKVQYRGRKNTKYDLGIK